MRANVIMQLNFPSLVIFRDFSSVLSGSVSHSQDDFSTGRSSCSVERSDCRHSASMRICTHPYRTLSVNTAILSQHQDDEARERHVAMHWKIIDRHELFILFDSFSSSCPFSPCSDEPVRNFYVGKDFKGDPPVLQKIAAGLTTSAIGITVASPTDVVKVN